MNQPLFIAGLKKAKNNKHGETKKTRNAKQHQHMQNTNCNDKYKKKTKRQTQANTDKKTTTNMKNNRHGQANINHKLIQLSICQYISIYFNQFYICLIYFQIV